MLLLKLGKNMDATNYINNVSSLANSSSNSAKFYNVSSQIKDIDANSIEQASKEFEEMFIGQLMQFMFETVEVNELFGGGHAEEIYRGMVVNEYAEKVSQSGGIGIAEQMQQYLLEIQMNN